MRIQKSLKGSKIGSNKIRIREDLAKEKIVFNQESSQAIFEMGNVQLLGLKTSRIQCPSCLHYVFKGTLLCRCGGHIRPDQEMTRRIKAAFEKFKAPCFRASFVVSRGETRPSLVAGAPRQGDLPYSAAFTSTYEVSTKIGKRHIPQHTKTSVPRSKDCIG